MVMSKIEEAMAKNGWVTLRTAADKMGVSLSTVYRLADDETLKVMEAAGKRYVSVKSCLDYLGPEAARAMGLAPKVSRPSASI